MMMADRGRSAFRGHVQGRGVCDAASAGLSSRRLRFKFRRSRQLGLLRFSLEGQVAQSVERWPKNQRSTDRRPSLTTTSRQSSRSMSQGRQRCPDRGFSGQKDLSNEVADAAYSSVSLPTQMTSGSSP